jgi:hypothetical protein
MILSSLSVVSRRTHSRVAGISRLRYVSSRKSYQAVLDSNDLLMDNQGRWERKRYIIQAGLQLVTVWDHQGLRSR